MMTFRACKKMKARKARDKMKAHFNARKKMGAPKAGEKMIVRKKMKAGKK